VYAGNVDLKGNGESYDIAQVIIHEDYDKDDNYFNDIALVKVSYLHFFLFSIFLLINLSEEFIFYMQYKFQ